MGTHDTQMTELNSQAQQGGAPVDVQSQSTAPVGQVLMEVETDGESEESERRDKGKDRVSDEELNLEGTKEFPDGVVKKKAGTRAARKEAEKREQKANKHKGTANNHTRSRGK